MTGGGHLPTWLIGVLPASVQDRVIARIVHSWTSSQARRCHAGA